MNSPRVGIWEKARATYSRNQIDPKDDGVYGLMH